MEVYEIVVVAMGSLGFIAWLVSCYFLHRAFAASY